MHQPRYPHWNDYVFRDGKMVGEFDAMYKDHSNPWKQSEIEPFASDKAVAIALLARAKARFGIRRVLDLGCGLGHLTRRISDLGLDAHGWDISPTAISQAQTINPGPTYSVGNISDLSLIESSTPDVIVMLEVTWYVIDLLPAFLAHIRRTIPNTLLLHCITLYPPGKQKLYTNTFTDGHSLRQYFGMTYLEHGEIHSWPDAYRSFFLGTWHVACADTWHS